MTTTLRWTNPDGWIVVEAKAVEPFGGERRAAPGTVSAVATGTDFFNSPQVRNIFTVVETIRAETKQEQPARRDAMSAVEITAKGEPGEVYLLAVRHPSGALTFHRPEPPEPARRSAPGKSKKTAKLDLKFHVPLRPSIVAQTRRSLLGPAVKGIIEAFLIKIANAVAEPLVKKAEAAIWSRLDRSEGWKKITPQTLLTGQLEPLQGAPSPHSNGRALLLLHGTFSCTASAFKGLATTDFFERAHTIYGDAIYGFDHYSVSVTPEENARTLLAGLGNGTTVFDVITHSRGGLVLRNLVERPAVLGSRADRFKLSRAVLVASPNEGTPFVTPAHLEKSVEWIANILEVLAPATVAVTAGAIAQWIGWFARFAVSSAPGLASMEVGGQQIEDLQMPPAPEPDAYSVLVSNFVPDDRLWARILDVGIDSFFDTPNDLVVPTGGGWRIDKLAASIPVARIGCFGPGGNISDSGKPVSHLDFFARPESTKFLFNALEGLPQELPAFEIERRLPDRRQAPATQQDRGPPPPEQRLQSGEMSGKADAAPTASTSSTLSASAPSIPSNVLELTVVRSEHYEDSNGALESMNDEGLESVPLLLAAYRGARVAVPFRISKQRIARSQQLSSFASQRSQLEEHTVRWDELIGMHRKIKRYVDGREGAAVPPERDLIGFGDILFDTLFPGNVRRLFDVARTQEARRPLVIFTSMIPWVFDMPWEFARDPGRGTFLATEDVHFIRNILTPTPVDRLQARTGALRMLIAVSEPRGLAPLAADREAVSIENGLAPLVQTGLINIKIQKNTTAADLHHEVATGGYDIVHFIGHGYWDPVSRKSGLVLDDGSGGSDRLEDRSLREILSGRGIRVVFLNACDTGRSLELGDTEQYSIGGTAQDLFGRGIPIVVANQLKVRDRAAVDFAREFYRYLAHGKSIADATREARIAVSYARNRESIDWAIPVVYARDAGGALVESK